MKQIAHIESVYKSKFGVPRQAGLVDIEAQIVFEKEYRVVEAVRGLEEFDYVWLIWGFHLVEREGWSPTVRPPRLGGNKRMGVFATRSPFRPNPLGLSSVRLLRVDVESDNAPVLYITGADLVDGTPIYDIKPYIPYADSHPEARGGFTDNHQWQQLEVVMPEELHQLFQSADLEVLRQTLALDPRPHYQQDASRQYSMPFMGYDIRFHVVDRTLFIDGWEK